MEKIKIAKIIPKLSPDKINELEQSRFSSIEKLNRVELKKRLKQRLSEMRGIKFIDYFDSDNKKVLKEKLTILLSYPYDHFERLGYLYK